MISILGAGFLVGTALAVIIPKVCMRYMSQRIMVRLLSESLLLRALVSSLVAYVTVVLVSIFCLCKRPFYIIIVKFDDWHFFNSCEH